MYRIFHFALSEVKILSGSTKTLEGNLRVKYLGHDKNSEVDTSQIKPMQSTSFYFHRVCLLCTWTIRFWNSLENFQFNIVTFGDMSLSWYVMTWSNQFAEVYSRSTGHRQHLMWRTWYVCGVGSYSRTCSGFFQWNEFTTTCFCQHCMFCPISHHFNRK